MRLPNFLKRYHLKDYKMNLVLLVLALSVIGVFVIGSAEPDNQSRQIIGLAFGPLDQPWLYPFPAFRACKNPADPVFCQIYH